MTLALEVGTFVKTNSPQVMELLGTTGLDFVCIDAEHAPFGRNALDAMLMASRAARLRAFVRIADMQPATVLNALDLGADGLLVPHVDSADDARALVALARYRGGKRGYSGSPRAAGYGSLSTIDVLRKGDATPLICQIESAAAVQQAEAIAAVPGVDGLFIGRADLALTMGVDNSRDERVTEATRHVLDVALRRGLRAGMHVAGNADRNQFAAMGANWFIVSSDQGLLRQAALDIAISRR